MTSSQRGIVVGLRGPRDTIRILGGILGALLMVSMVAAEEEVRQTAFADELLGSWAPTNALCQANNKAKITISEIMYHSPERTCGVLWIVETPAVHATNYPSTVCALTRPNHLKLTHQT